MSNNVKFYNLVPRAFVISAALIILSIIAVVAFARYAESEDVTRTSTGPVTPYDNTCVIIGEMGQLMAEARDELREKKVDDDISRAAVISTIKDAKMVASLEQLLIDSILPLVYDELDEISPPEVKTHVSDWCRSHVGNTRPGEPNRSVNISI